MHTMSTSTTSQRRSAKSKQERFIALRAMFTEDTLPVHMVKRGHGKSPQWFWLYFGTEAPSLKCHPPWRITNARLGDGTYTCFLKPVRNVKRWRRIIAAFLAGGRRVRGTILIES